MQLLKEHIEFLGVEIGKGKIKLQPHISRKILEYPDKLDNLKQLQGFLGSLNYTRPFIKDLSKYTGPLYNKTSAKGTRNFNYEDIKLVQRLKKRVMNLPEMSLPLDSDYLIVQTDGSEHGWGGILLKRPSKYSSIHEEQLCRYASGTYKEKGRLTSLDFEVLVVINSYESFALFLTGKKEITLRTDCEALVKFTDMKKISKLLSNRWLKLNEYIIGKGIKFNFEHIKGKTNVIPYLLSRFKSF